MAVKCSMSCFGVSLERFGAGKFLHCSKDVLDKVLPALVQLTTDPSPEARYSLQYLYSNSLYMVFTFHVKYCGYVHMFIYMYLMYGKYYRSLVLKIFH